MDTTTFTQILHACKLARDLETNLPNFATRPPEFLLSSCEDVATAFDRAIHLLRSQSSSPADMGSGGGGYMQAMELLGPRASDDDDPNFFLPDVEMGLQELPEIDTPEFGLGAGLVIGGGGGGLLTLAAAEGSSVSGRRPAGSGSSVHRPSRKRKDAIGRTIRVPAPRTGNTEIPPDDGYTWRKYGQKDILGSRFPRGYYRCTHKSFYGCEAKKQVQRLDDDPYTYEVTYCGDHTCLTSTAPLVLPSLTPTASEQQGGATMLTTSIQLGSWLSREPQGRESSGGRTGSSQVQGGRDVDCPVADFADAMFNSSSSGSSIDAIFLMKQEH